MWVLCGDDRSWQTICNVELSLGKKEAAFGLTNDLTTHLSLSTLNMYRKVIMNYALTNKRLMCQVYVAQIICGLNKMEYRT